MGLNFFTMATGVMFIQKSEQCTFEFRSKFICIRFTNREKQGAAGIDGVGTLLKEDKARIFTST